MYICGIEEFSDANGNGFRTVIYISGCWFNCEDCQNPETHDPCVGSEISVEDLFNRVKGIKCKRVTLSGGDGLTYQYKDTLEFLKLLKADGFNVWEYTGYRFEELLESNKKECLQYIDVLVDGRYEKDKRNLLLPYRGSENQRLVDVQATLNQNSVITLG